MVRVQSVSRWHLQGQMSTTGGCLGLTHVSSKSTKQNRQRERENQLGVGRRDRSGQGSVKCSACTSTRLALPCRSHRKSNRSFLDLRGGNSKSETRDSAVVSRAAAAGASIASQGLWSNTVFKAGFVAWISAQVLKVVTSYISTRSLDWRPLFDSGGMPSSHSSLCMGVTTAVAVLHGMGSSLFPICLGFSAIVMYDAANVRLEAGKHAQILNAVVNSGLKLDDGLSFTQLKEVLGHSKTQVMCGAVLGVIVGLLVR